MKAQCIQNPHGILKKIFKLFWIEDKFIQTNIKSLEQISVNETLIRSKLKIIN